MSERERRRCALCKRDEIVWTPGKIRRRPSAGPMGGPMAAAAADDREAGTYHLVKYGVRHYAHPICLASRNGTAPAREMIPEHQWPSFDRAMAEAGERGSDSWQLARLRVKDRQLADKMERERAAVSRMSKAERDALLEQQLAERERAGTVRAYAVIGDAVLEIGENTADGPALTIACDVSYCRAPVGSSCRGAGGMLVPPHYSRHQRAIDQQARGQQRTWACWEMFKGKLVISDADPIRVLGHAAALALMVPDDAGMLVAVGDGEAPHHIDDGDDLGDGWTTYWVHVEGISRSTGIERCPVIPGDLALAVLGK